MFGLKKKSIMLLCAVECVLCWFPTFMSLFKIVFCKKICKPLYEINTLICLSLFYSSLF